MNVDNSQKRLVETAILPECKTSVVIPVRDEAATLPGALEAFRQQKDFRDKRLDPRSFEIIILANNCADDSAAIVRRFQNDNPDFPLHLAEVSLAARDSNVGFVRRLLKDEARRRLLKNRFGGGVIMTTDADTIVAPDWIAANLHEIERGTDAVGGRILIAEAELQKMDAACRTIYLQDEEYRLLTAEIEVLIDDLPHDAGERHHQHFNASFAVTTEAYVRAGGVPPVKFLEDVALYDALMRVDAKFRHSARVKVYTSARSAGRSEVGLSYQINEWQKLSAAEADFLVEAAETIVARFDLRSRLRKIWRALEADDGAPGEAEVRRLAADFCVPENFLCAELGICQTFGRLYENVTRQQEILGEWTRRNPPVPLKTALADLRLLIKQYRRARHAASL